jgi:hypothetical protein
MSFSSFSKSQFLRGLKCKKSLWLYRNRPDLRTEPDAFQQALFNQGKQVGIVARDLFPNGETIEFEGSSFEEKIEQTKSLIDGGAQTIYEATFQYKDVVVMVDILHQGKHGWELYEVKSSTSLRKVYEYDLSIQHYLVSGSGLDLHSASLIHINNHYVRQGDLDLHELFAISDFTEAAVSNQGFIEKEMVLISEAVNGAMPERDIGLYCNAPYKCDYKEHCWEHIPEVSVFDINFLGKGEKFELYYNGIVEFADLLEDYNLNRSQQLQVEAELTGREFVELDKIRDFLRAIHYPLYFLDFESVSHAIPQFERVRPFQQIPFQYSLHFQESEGGELKHEEFLAEAGTDPRETLATRLISAIPEEACVLTYNCGFEKGVIRKLADQFPQHFDRLMNIHNQIKDLMIPFQRKYLYTKAMKGKYSIKHVLPALVPELNHDQLAISDGLTASNTFATLHLIQDKSKVEEIRGNLLEYCKLDTLAMLKILDKLRNIARQ